MAIGLAEERLEGGASGRLVIGAWVGSVNVRATPGRTVRVAVERWPLLPPPLVEIQRDGSDVFVRCTPPVLGLPSWLWRGLRLEVSVPARTAVEVRTGRGGVDVEGVVGEVDAYSTNGPLVFREVRGPIDARSAAGSIDVAGCRGDVEASTARGSIEIRDVVGQVSVHAGRGRITVTDPLRGQLRREGGGSIEIDGATGALAFA